MPYPYLYNSSDIEAMNRRDVLQWISEFEQPTTKNPTRSNRKLQNSIERLYEAFPYPTPTKIVTDEYSDITPEEVTQLTNADASKLTWDSLKPVINDILLTWGTVEVYKSYLPRILELFAIARDNRLFSTQVILGRVIKARWREWPKAEQMALEQYYRALWNDTLVKELQGNQWESSWEVFDTFDSISVILEEPVEFIAVWNSLLKTPQTALRLANNIFRIAPTLQGFPERFVQNWWPHQKSSQDIIDVRTKVLYQWVTSSPVRIAFEESFYHFSRIGHDEAADICSEAEQLSRCIPEGYNEFEEGQP